MKAYKTLHSLSRQIALLEGIGHLLDWDKETVMPRGAAPIRAEQIEAIAKLAHSKRSGKGYRNALDKLIDIESGAIKAANLSKAEEAALRCWRRDYRIAAALPNSFVAAFARTTAEASAAWQEARKESRFSLFSPHLQKIISFCRKEADYLGYNDQPYDALLELYEPGMKTKDIEALFAEIKTPLVQLLKKSSAAQQADNSFLFGNFSEERQLVFGREMLKVVGYDQNHGRIDLSAHPFSSSYHPYDSRITTRLHSGELMGNISALLHECGHSFYDMGLPADQYGSPLCQPISFGIHESQSRWWETRIGLSKPFWSYFLPLLKKEFGGKLSAIALDPFWRAINKVAPSHIRVEADEVTYPLHIMLRFEIEKELISGKLSIDEIPERWNSLSTALLGITPSNDAEGCLQDVHWSSGGFGYFPTYTLGNMYCAQLFEAFEKQHPDWEKRVEKGEFAFITHWLGEAVWRHGRQYDGKGLMKTVTGLPFSAAPYLRYLENKYFNIK